MQWCGTLIAYLSAALGLVVLAVIGIAQLLPDNPPASPSGPENTPRPIASPVAWNIEIPGHMSRSSILGRPFDRVRDNVLYDGVWPLPKSWFEKEQDRMGGPKTRVLFDETAR